MSIPATRRAITRATRFKYVCTWATGVATVAGTASFLVATWLHVRAYQAGLLGGRDLTISMLIWAILIAVAGFAFHDQPDWIVKAKWITWTSFPMLPYPMAMLAIHRSRHAH